MHRGVAVSRGWAPQNGWGAGVSIREHFIEQTINA